MRQLIPWWGWGLLILLATSACLISLGQSEDMTKPVASSYAPSGTAALAELLREQGFTVVVDSGTHPKLRANDLALVFSVQHSSFREASKAEIESQADVVKHLSRGGFVLHLPISDEFRMASTKALSVKPKLIIKATPNDIKGVADRAERLNIFSSAPLDSTNELRIAQPGVDATLWHGGDFYARAVKVKKGTLIRVSDGLLATNRFLDRADDARLMISLIQTIKPAPDRIVFAEAVSGHGSELGFFAAIGDWALAAWYQVLFVGLVIIFTLSMPFGLPDARRPAQRGSRELVDAVSSTMSRTKSAKTSAQLALDSLMPQLRKSLGLPYDALPSDAIRRLPSDAAKALSAVAVASTDDQLRPDQALGLIRKLEIESSEWVRIPRSLNPLARKRLRDG